jgi:hypothetical protein
MLQRTGKQLLQQVLRQGGAAQQVFTRGVQFWDAPNGPAVTQQPIEEEWYNRQRPLLPLLDKVPFIQDDTWIAPNAVVVGDVDLYDQVRKQGFQMARSLHPSASAFLWHCPATILLFVWH